VDVLLEAEVEKRERNVVKRRLKEAHFSKVKTLEEFDFEAASHISSARLRKLAEGEYVSRTEPVIFIGETDPGTFCTSLLHH
jgi:DNA replication protein DnaC